MRPSPLPYMVSMTIRFDPTTHTLWLSIGDLVDTTAFPGSVPLTPMLRSRAAMGRETHAVHQAARQAALPSYRAEVTIRQQLLVDDYTVHLQGRIDGLYEEAMMEQVRLAIRDQSCVLLSAPTGIGKTVAALYPALEHALRDGLRVFFVTAKTTQQALAVETLRQLAEQGVQFTAVHLRAKEKSCLNEIYYCHENVCEFARDYASKLERAHLVDRLLELPVLGPTVCAEVGQHYRVCPFELSLDVAVEADVIIGDYNYVFDPGSYLRRFFQDTPYDDCVLIIDEAHNLYARGRDYYSPVLRQRRVRQLLNYCTDEPARLFRDFAAFFMELDN